MKRKFEAKCHCGGRITGDTVKWRHDRKPAKRHTAQAVGTITEIDDVKIFQAARLAQKASLFELPQKGKPSAATEANYQAIQEEIWRREAADGGSPYAANQDLLQRVIAAQKSA